MNSQRQGGYIQCFLRPAVVATASRTLIDDHAECHRLTDAVRTKTCARSAPTRSDAPPPHPLGEQALATPHTMPVIEVALKSRA